jgi:Bacterial extracellular solute-binding proteins, family 3
VKRRSALLAVLPVAAPASTERVLRYARQGDPERDFFYHLLRAALDEAEHGWHIQPSKERVSHARALMEVQRQGGEADIVWTMTSIEREQTLQPIRIPLERGLFGWRVLLVRKGETRRFAGVRRLADLKPFSFLQGHDWPDARILEANGLRVERSTNFDSLFPMLVKGRADAFPRGAVEVLAELRHYNNGGVLELEPGLVLRYPTAVYYFVRPERSELAALIERGLRGLQASGGFDRLLLRFYAESLQLVKLTQRHVIQLQNPLLPPRTPLSDSSLWFTSR